MELSYFIRQFYWKLFTTFTEKFHGGKSYSSKRTVKQLKIEITSVMLDLVKIKVSSSFQSLG